MSDTGASGIGDARRCPARNEDGEQCGDYAGHSGKHTTLIASAFVRAAAEPEARPVEPAPGTFLCDKCGATRARLPAGGVCPECGVGIDSGNIVATPPERASGSAPPSGADGLTDRERFQVEHMRRDFVGTGIERGAPERDEAWRMNPAGDVAVTAYARLQEAGRALDEHVGVREAGDE